MATLRRYNKVTKQWENIASDDASGIYTDNSILTGDDSGNVKSVEDVLLKDRLDIEKLQRNVSWLAKHGGGGGGYGGGGGNIVATISILNPSDDVTTVDSLVWSNDISHLSYKLTSNVKTTFTVTVKLNGNVVQTDIITAKNEIKSISITNIKKYIGKGGTLTITALDPSETEHSALCRLVISSVILNDSSLQVTSSQLESHASYKLRMSYRSNVYGKYRLYFSKTMIYVRDDKVVDQDGNDLDVTDTDAGQFITLNIQESNVQFTEIDVIETGLLESAQVDPGTYNIYFLLVSENNILVRSSVAVAQITVLITDGILVNPQTGSLTNPYTVAKDNILPLQFIVYSNNRGTYAYSIMIGDNQIGNTVTGNSFNTQVTVPINISNYEFLEEGNDYIITIQATQGTIKSEAQTKIKVIQASSSHLEKYKENLKKYTIFNYTFYDLSNITGSNERYVTTENSIKYTNSQYYYKTQDRTEELSATLSLNNIGIDSGTTGNYYKFRHTAYGEIKTNHTFYWFQRDNNQNSVSCFIPHYNYEFTLQVAYHIDEEEDDNATILNMGNFDIRQKTGHGIVITSHKLYINLEKTYIEEDLQDNDFTQLDIVSELVNNEKYWIRIYQNAKLLSTKILEIDEEYSSGSYLINSVFLGGKSYTDEETKDSINVDIYSVKFYSTALNIGHVLCSYINNFAEYNRTESGLPSELITELCENNQINSKESEIENYRDISSIYDFEKGEYTWGITALGNNITVPDSISKLPIPIVTLSVDWSFDDFTSGRANDRPAENSPFTYKSPNKTSEEYVPNQTVSSNVTVEVQGTTSVNYTIKNLNITFDDDTLFSPIHTWFPENKFTLKADVVDSGHINNAVIGKFVNDCFTKNPGALLMNMDCFPTVKTVKRLQNESKLPENLTVKATIEGFPVLLIVNFKKGDARDPRILGIYSFNLGRESYYNQGYKVPNFLYKKPKNDNERAQPYTVMSEITFPSLFGVPTDVDTEYPGYCYEGQASYNCSTRSVDFSEEQYDYAEVKMGDGIIHKYPALQSISGYASYGNVILKDKNGNNIPFDSEHIQKVKINPDGFFWSRHESYWKSLWKFVADPSIVNIDKANKAFASLNTCIATKLLYKKGTIQQSYGAEVEEYRISIQGDTIQSSPTGSKFTLISAQSDAEPVDISVQNTSFYYVIAMLFGLVDSMGKNMQMKYWEGGSSYWSPTFYDMDTALGISNTGAVTIKPNVLDYSIFNTQENKAQPMFGQLNSDQSDIELYTVYSNKLWGIENSDFVRQYSQDFSANGGGNDNSPSSNFFAQMWHNLRTTLLLDADEFFEKYFAHQFDGCGEFLMNYDYTVKYLETAQTDFLHGNRLSFIKNWLEKRITFLDSVFGFCQRAQNSVDYSLTNYLEVSNSITSTDLNGYRVPWRNEIVLHHNSGSLTMPVITNRDVIMKVTVGGVNTSYTYVPSGVETNIIVAENIGTRDIQTNINNSDTIVDLPDLRTIGLTNIVPRSSSTIYTNDGSIKYASDTSGNLKTQWGTLSSLKNFDLSGIKTYNSDIDFFRLFKTWDTSELGIDPTYFSLYSLNLSNMLTGSKLSVNLKGESGAIVPKTYSNPFINLSRIDVSNSDINNVDIPENVSLFSLNISNSRISAITLKQQPLLKSISFIGCKNLTTVKIIGCPNFKEIRFDSTNISLNSVSITGCGNLETFAIEPGENNGYVHVPDVVLEDNENLKTVILTKLGNKLESDPPSILNIKECPNIKYIDLKRSRYHEIIWDKDSNSSDGKIRLDRLDLSGSSIKVMRKANESNNTDVLDMTGIYSITYFMADSNENLEYVRFDNVESDPFVIVRESVFSNCNNLKRVYGNIRLDGAATFYNCRNFSVLGKDTTSYSGVTMVQNNDNGSVKLVKHFEDEDIKSRVTDTETGTPLFQTSEDSTNIMIAGSGSRTFMETSCTILDAYYILYNIGPNVKNLGETFRGASGITWNWSNSPSRYMFKNCRNVTSVSSCFRNVPSKKYKLYSPTKSDIGNGNYYYNDDGLFSPLINCTNIALLFYGGTFAIDKHLFRRKTGDYKISNMSHFYPSFVIDDVNNSNSYPSFDILSSQMTAENLRSDAESESETKKYGDLGGFFTNLSSVNNANGAFNGVRFINYDCFNSEHLNVPVTLKELRLFFRSTYSYGSLGSKIGESGNDFDKIFRVNNNTVFEVTGIYSSFITTNSSLCGRFNLSNDTFKFFNYILGIGYKVDNSDFSSTEKSFNGFQKFIITDFPYGIVPNFSKITQFSGVFMGASFENTPLNTIELPRNMFEGCSELTDVSYLFHNFNSNYTLSSSAPFRDCSKLNNVDYLFSCDVDTRRLHYLQGSIPTKLFYHGEMEYTSEVTGLKENDARASEIVYDVEIKNSYAVKTLVNSDSQKQVRTYSGFKSISGSNTSIKCIPTTTIKDEITYYFPVTERIEVIDEETGEIYTEERTVIKSKTSTVRKYWGDDIQLTENDISRVTYSKPNATISHMVGCFQGANIQTYLHESPYTSEEAEILSTYQPFTYVFKNNGWEVAVPNTKRYTLMWVYDGRVQYYKNSFIGENANGLIEDECEFLDDALEDCEGTIYMPRELDGTIVESNSGLFCCAPDLLRYCTPNPLIYGMFKLCGQLNASAVQWNQLLTIVGDENCYKYGLHGRIVPYLFKPTPNVEDLHEFFMGCKLLGWYSKEGENYTIPQSLFEYIESRKLDLSKMFMACHFPKKISLNVFIGKAREYNVTETFRYACYDAKSDDWATIQGIFNDTRLIISGLRSCFRVSASDTDSASGDSLAMIRSCYVNFINNFKVGNFPKSDACFVYDGYKEGDVGFGETKELPTDVSSRNYRTVSSWVLPTDS